MDGAITTKRLRIAGRVQGVGYRAGFARQAQGLGLAGWVRNRRDGTVEALVHGSAQEVDQIIAWARRGPAMADVDQVHISDASGATISSREFTVMPTE